MATKVIKRFFGLADFLEEERFLERQHQDGWRFSEFIASRKYVFEECLPENYIYRLDFNETDEDDEDYIQIFKDCGWEYIMKYQAWFYFRKVKSEMNELDNEIFSDSQSRVDMVKKVMRKQLLLIAPFLFFIPIFVSAISKFFIENIVFQIIWIIYTLIMAFLLSMCVHNVIKLNKLVQELQNPFDN